MKTIKPTTTKKPVKHYLEVDKGTDAGFLKQVVETLQSENPGDEIIVIYQEKINKEDLSTTPPSKVKSRYWIQAFRKKGKYPKPTKKSGKWLIFREKTEIDQVWDKVRLATEKGLLGHGSKVSTGKDNPNGKYNKGVICVYTYDWTDEKDIKRVREELRKIGIVERIPYKSDQDTSDGKYATTGHTQISKYHE